VRTDNIKHVLFCCVVLLAGSCGDKNHPRAFVSATLANPADYSGAPDQVSCHDSPSAITINGRTAIDQPVTDGSGGVTITCTIQRSAGYKVALEAVQRTDQPTWTEVGTVEQERTDHFRFDGTIDDSGQGSGVLEMDQHWSVVGSWGPYDNQSSQPCVLSVSSIAADHITAAFACDRLLGTAIGAESACSVSGTFGFDHCD